MCLPRRRSAFPVARLRCCCERGCRRVSGIERCVSGWERGARWLGVARVGVSFCAPRVSLPGVWFLRRAYVIVRVFRDIYVVTCFLECEESFP